VPDAYDLLDGPPTPEEYVRLRREAGLSPKSLEQAAAAIAGSWAFRTVRAAGEAVAMGRLIGDGAWYFVVADMAVLPDHQRRGLGGRILDGLLAELERRTSGAYVSLVADPPGVGLYRSRGFREPGEHSLAMDRKVGRP
jgi:GNAT superfamily N-acetyltransferase